MRAHDWVTSVSRVIPAPPAKIFAYLADASKHAEIDGSGTVKGAKAGAPQQLTLGSRFGMDMKMGVNYSMVSTVVEFEPDRRIAWQTKSSFALLDKVAAGRIWRYVLEPVAGGTRVTESWDISQDKQRWMLAPMRARTRENMEKTLARIETLVTA
jgi:uncharacterized protein YndB with AHSA1/START domain